MIFHDGGVGDCDSYESRPSCELRDLRACSLGCPNLDCGARLRCSRELDGSYEQQRGVGSHVHGFIFG